MVRCPECGEEFVNTRGLGTHRHYAHGYQGEIRIKPSDLESPEAIALSRRLARVELKLEKCRVAYKDLNVAYRGLKVAYRDLNVAYKSVITKLQGVRKALERKGKGEPGSAKSSTARRG